MFALVVGRSFTVIKNNLKLRSTEVLLHLLSRVDRLLKNQPK